MRNLLLVSLLLASASVNAYPGVWAENPEEDFHAHPLVEISGSGRNFARARVRKLLREASRRESGLLRAEISSGPRAGEYIYVSVFYTPQVEPLRENENIVISFQDGAGEDAVFESRDRLGSLALLLIIFIILVASVGGKRSLYSIAALGAGIAVCWVVLGRIFEFGRNPLYDMGLAVSFVVMITTLAIGGVSSKSFSAAIGSFAGLGVGAFTGWVFFYGAGVTGFHFEEVQLLHYATGYGSGFFIDFMTGLLLLGAAGVIMDSAVSVASSMYEIKKNNPGITRVALRDEGVSIGRDVTLTMASTLAVAYLGGALPLMLAGSLHLSSVTQLVNLPSFHLGLYSVLLGSTAFAVSARVTAWVGAKII